MAPFDYDLFTIGAGSGGVAGSRRAAAHGARVGIAEASRIGGTCVLRGCVPKKILVYGSHFHDDFDDARGFGWSFGQPSLDWPALIKSKNHELDRLNGLYERMLRDAGVTVHPGRARVLDAHTVEVEGKAITAGQILVATGGHPLPPDIHGKELGISSNEALDLPSLPRDIVIVGGGYIGVEFAGIFAAMGVKVTLVIRGDRVLRGFDEDVRTHLTKEISERGVALRLDSMIRSLEKETDGRLSLRIGHDETLEADQVLFATGRAPNTAGLGLAEAGVALRESGAVVVDEASRTAVESIFAIGDCTDRMNLTPVAIAEGRALADTLFAKRPRTVLLDIVPTAVFSQPPVATVGLSESRARELHGEIDVYVSSFRPMKNTISGRATRTLLKMVVDSKTDRVLGCHMVGPDAPEIIQGMAIALTAGATKAHFDATIGIHPTAAEEFVTLREKRPRPELR